MTAIGIFLLGLLLLLLGADSLLRGVAGFARKAGLSATTTGLLLLGLVGAAPQLVVNGYALATGARELAFGHAIGGNLASLGLVLGIAALVNPLQARMRLLGAQALAVLGAAGLVLLLGLDGSIAAWEGIVLLVAFVALLFAAFGRVQREDDKVRAELADFAETSTNTTQNFIRLGLGGTLLFAGARWIVLGAPGTGQLLGLDALATGLSLVAVGAVLPSILLAVMAASNEQGSVAVAQSLGACLCNLLLSVGALALAAPVPVHAPLLRIALPATMLLAVLLHLLLRQGARIARREGVLLVCAFLAWLGVVIGGAIS